MVSDLPFNSLYGTRRGAKKQRELALRFFRPVKNVAVTENAGPDMVVFAVEESAKTPYAVLFPYRYYEGARRYLEKYPGVPALILGDRGPPDPALRDLFPGEALFARADARTDYYRAGLAAAFLARGRPGRPLCFHDGRISPAERAALRAGLRDGGCGEAPLFLEGGGGYAEWQEVSSVILGGPGAAFLDRNLKIPAVLFSWIDPALTPGAVKVVFDDSPWALGAGALEAAIRGGEERLFPSEAAVLPGRAGTPEQARFLREELRKTP
jgi:hypothetical protein